MDPDKNPEFFPIFHKIVTKDIFDIFRLSLINIILTY